MIVKDTPLWKVIANDIQLLIKSNSFDYDHPICTERSICEKYRVSRITAKHAITTLQQHGILYRKRGLGSFVVKTITADSPQKTFALVIPFSATEGGTIRIIETVNLIFAEKKYQMSIYVDQLQATQNLELLKNFYNSVDGIIYYPLTSALPLEILNTFVQQKKPVIILDKTTAHSEFTHVICDHYKGGYMLTEHLLSLGHTKTCYLSRFKPEELASISERYKGYHDCLTASGIEPYFIHWDAAEREQTESYNMLQHFITTLRLKGITAIICENDKVAFNVYMCCQDLGIRVPEDISITGFDNIEWATMGSASITTIDQNFELIGEGIAAVLTDQNYKPKNYTIPVKLIHRTSTGKAK